MNKKRILKEDYYMQGFTVICNKCSNQANLTIKKYDDMPENVSFIESDNDTLQFCKSDHDVEEIVCKKCGNKVVNDFR
jgi:DNA-directed RNA polymerase subunit RPC12/RpoP